MSYDAYALIGVSHHFSGNEMLYFTIFCIFRNSFSKK